MSVAIALSFNIYGDTHSYFVEQAEARIADFFEIDYDDVRKKFNYEIDVKENQEMMSDYAYEALVVVKSRDV